MSCDVGPDLIDGECIRRPVVPRTRRLPVPLDLEHRAVTRHRHHVPLVDLMLHQLVSHDRRTHIRHAFRDGNVTGSVTKPNVGHVLTIRGRHGTFESEQRLGGVTLTGEHACALHGCGLGGQRQRQP